MIYHFFNKTQSLHPKYNYPKEIDKIRDKHFRDYCNCLQCYTAILAFFLFRHTY